MRTSIKISLQTDRHTSFSIRIELEACITPTWSKVSRESVLRTDTY